MIKKLLSLAFVSSAVLLNAQSFTATYSFAATTTASPVMDPSTPPTASGLTCGIFQAVGTNSVNASAGRFSFNNWPIATTSGSLSAATYTDMGGSIDLGKYYEVTLIPNSGNQLTLNSMDFVARRSATAPRSFAVRSNVGSYASNLPATVAGTGTVITIAGTNEFFFSVDGNTNYFSGNTITFGSPFVNLTSAVTVRIYAWNSESTAGNFAIDDVTFNGSTSLTTGLGSITSELNAPFTIYPVPSNDGVVFIDNKNTSEISKIEVMDIVGKVVSTTLPTTNKVMLDLSAIANGTYSVRVTTNASISIQKIIVNK